MWKRTDLFNRIVIPSLFLLACSGSDQKNGLSSAVLENLKQLGSTEGFKYYEGNPILDTGRKSGED